MTIRKPIIAGNHKMNKTQKELAAYIKELKPLVENAKADVVICVPFTNLEVAAKLTKGSNIAVGSQNISFADSGAYTGEVSGDMLLEIGVKYAIVGHSERRQYFGETDSSVNGRVKKALEKGITPIVCVGETLEEREQGRTESIVKAQTIAAFKDIKSLESIVIAYEPVWAIGTGKVATSGDAQDTIKYIRGVLREIYGDAADSIRIQYGGSMNANNARELMQQADIDGGLIGGASLSPVDFSKVVNY